MEQTPTISKTQVTYSFPQVIDLILAGKAVTRLSWDNKREYFVLQSDFLRLHKADGQFYNLIVSLGDMTADDYVIVEHPVTLPPE